MSFHVAKSEAVASIALKGLRNRLSLAVRAIKPASGDDFSALDRAPHVEGRDRLHPWRRPLTREGRLRELQRRRHQVVVAVQLDIDGELAAPHHQGSRG